MGYEWSTAKGNEGIKYLTTQLGENTDSEDEVLQHLQGINKIETQKSIIAQVNEWEAQIAQCEAKLSGSLNAKKAILEQYL